MTKKKISTPGSPIGYVGAAVIGSEPAPVRDNNPDGPSSLPIFGLDGTRYPKGKMSFVNNVARGESCADGDVKVNTANGVSSSKGKGKMQYNWSDENQSGAWNDNSFGGGNLTGL